MFTGVPGYEPTKQSKLSSLFFPDVWWEKCAITQTAWNVKRDLSCSLTHAVTLRDKWQITSERLNQMIVDCCTGSLRIYLWLLVGKFNNLCFATSFDTGPIYVSLKALKKTPMKMYNSLTVTASEPSCREQLVQGPQCAVKSLFQQETYFKTCADLTAFAFVCCF